MTFEQYKEQYNICLNEQQEKAVQSVNGNVLLLAVPGSGKTTVLVARLGYMIYACGIAPENILTMTYTVAAATDMKKRFISMFGDEYSNRLIFKTINAVCYSIIRSYSRIKGTMPFELIEETDRSALLSRLFKEVNNEWPTDLQKKAMGLDITFVKNMMFSEDEILELKAENYNNFPKLYERYNEELRKMRRMDFDDQLTYTYSILTKYPDILNQFRKQYRYICVDEAQDTSKIQHEIIKLIAVGYGDNKTNSNYFAVGDEDQSIYGFRAAYPEALYNFEHDYDNAKVLLMEKNYRSTKSIVTSADWFIQKNKNRHPKAMVADREEVGEPIEFKTFDNRAAQYVVLLDIARNTKIQTAVLFHDNDSSIPIIDRLSRENIGYRARGLDSVFFSNPVILDVVGIIKFALGNCTDHEFFEKNYYKLGLYMKKEQAQYVLRFCPENKNIIEYIAENKSKKFPEKLSENAADTLEGYDLIKGSAGGAETAIGAITYTLKYKKYLENFHISDSALAILTQIAKNEPTAQRLLERLDELKDILAQGGTDAHSKFILSTVHSSKGLEYDRVIIIDAYEGLFPKCSKEDDPEGYEEERRLFYVAMTRAKDKLILYKYFTENCIFPKEVEADLNPKTKAIKPAKISGRTGSKLEDKLQPGIRINHKAFGTGVVEERPNEKSVLIAFDKGFKKDLVVDILLGNKLISYIDGNDPEDDNPPPKWMIV